MRVYFGIKYHADFANRLLIEKILTLLEQAGAETFCVVRDLEHWGETSLSPQVLMTQTFDMIQKADLVVIELSEKGVGLGIEAGYAYALKKPIVVIARVGSDISTTLKGIASNTHFYKNVSDLLIAFDF